MQRIRIQELLTKSSEFLDREGAITVAGWVRHIRLSSKTGFITLNDGSAWSGLQLVFEPDMVDAAVLEQIGVGAAIQARGRLVASPGKGQQVELQVDALNLIGATRSDYPLQKKRHSFEFLRQIAHLRPRSNTFSAVFRVRSLLSQAIHRFFEEEGFVYVHTPIITGSDCEGAGQMFQVTSLDLDALPRSGEGIDYSKDFFGKRCNLTVSGQLQLENFALAYDRVYTFGPTFRAEHSDTPRHAAEFWMVEPEIAFADLEDDMDLAEKMLKYLLHDLFEKAEEELAFFDRFIDKGIRERLQKLAESDFARITYDQAVAALLQSDRKFEYPVTWGADLQTEHERYLTEEYLQGPVFVTDYPETLKAFYMRRNEAADVQKRKQQSDAATAPELDKDEHGSGDDASRGATVAAMDLLVPGVGEIIGGSQREERPDVLETRMQEAGLDPEEYDWYLDLRRYGGVPHAGFGLGLERLVMYVTGMSNIRDVQPFPRTFRHAMY